MPLYNSDPINDPKLHYQKEPVNLSEEELQHYITPYDAPFYLRILRIIFFFVFLGPIKILICIICLITFFIMVTVLGKIGELSFIKDKRKYKYYASKLTYIPERICLFGLGIIHIKFTGELLPSTRTVVSNHLTMVDPVSILSQIPVSYLVMSGLKGNPFFTMTSKIFSLIYVDRSKKEGVTNQVREFQNDDKYLPLLIFPEGKVTNGECLLGFRSGAFVNNTPVQPLTIRYKMWLCPKKMATISWVEDDPIKYIFQLFSIPFMTLEISILDQITFDPEMSPRERASKVHLIMANYLGCLALKNDNKQIFQKHMNNAELEQTSSKEKIE